MVLKKLARTGLPVLFVLLAVAALVFHFRLSDAQTLSVQSGVLDLAGWNGENAFELAGEWEFYWDKLLSSQEIRDESISAAFMDAPDYWNGYELNGESLSGKGKATYRIRVTGAKAGARYGVRIQSMATVYRLYIDDALIAQNGSFGDTASAPILGYRPLVAAFTSSGDSFDIILHIENHAYAMGGMYEPVIFGIYEQIESFDRLISIAGASAIAGIIITCVFFLIFFAAQRGEKDMLILSGISILILLRFLTIGDAALTWIFPQLPLSWMVRIEFLSLSWTQFLLLCFVYCAYGNLVQRWQLGMLLCYSIGLSLFILLFPFYIVTSAYMVINLILLFVIAVITAQLMRAAWQGRKGAPLLLGALWLILLLVFYELFSKDRSTGYYLLSNLHFEYAVFVFAHVAVVSMRYRRAQKLEIAHLKGQIRPHFIHNSLTSIISISRTEPDRARELLVDFSSYLRGFYDYEQDEMVSFSQELELVRAYATLEQARFGEKYRLDYRIETEDFLLPPLILQPLVENAFVHGIREKDNGGTVTVYAIRVNNSKVRVGIRDDGAGFCDKPASARRGVGIENINRRLSQLYHTSLVRTVPEGGGCEVYFEIPCKEVARA